MRFHSDFAKYNQLKKNEMGEPGGTNKEYIGLF